MVIFVDDKGLLFSSVCRDDFAIDEGSGRVVDDVGCVVEGAREPEVFEYAEDTTVVIGGGFRSSVADVEVQYASHHGMVRICVFLMMISVAAPSMRSIEGHYTLLLSGEDERRTLEPWRLLVALNRENIAQSSMRHAVLAAAPAYLHVLLHDPSRSKATGIVDVSRRLRCCIRALQCVLQSPSENLRISSAEPEVILQRV